MTRDPGTWGVILMAVAMATLGSGVTAVLGRLGRMSARSQSAVYMWWPVIIVGSIAVVGGAAVSAITMAIISLQLVREFTRMTLSPADRALRWACFVAVPLHYGIVFGGDITLIFLGIVGWSLLVLPTVRMMSAGSDALTSSVARAQWGLMATVLGASHLAWISTWEHPGISPPRLMAFVLMLTFSGDAMQWVWGKTLGRHRIAPEISPKKSWEGLIGGALTVGVISAIIGPPLLGLSGLFSALLGVVVVPLGLLGDLVISAIKRDVGVKDTGSLLSAQGGLLDRMDGVLFTVPVVAHAVALWVGL